jgi:hypothetical protein
MVATVAVVLFSTLAAATVHAGQAVAPETPTTLATTLLSAEIVRFARPYRFPGPKRTVSYQEALVLRMAVKPAELLTLPMSADPVLHLGDRMYPIVRVDRSQRNSWTLEFHITDWQTLSGSVPLVLGVGRHAPQNIAESHRVMIDLSAVKDRRQGGK